MSDWQRDYAMLALRINRLAGGGLLIYRGPEQWSTQAASEPPPSPGAPAGEAERLLAAAPSAYLAGQVRAMRAVARYLDGERLPLAEYARQCLGLEPRRLPEEVFEAAHAELDAALPKGPGSPAERLRAWQAAHTLEPIERLPDMVAKAVDETRARTNAIVPLPDGEVVGCRLVDGVSFHGAGDYEGGLRSTIHINKAIPFNLADLLYLVAHEGHPGHIAESMLKEIHLAGQEDQRVRFMVSPSFVLSEGLGLLAEEILFPGDEAQVWLSRHVFPDAGIKPGGVGDLAAIHHAKNVLWGVWGNVAFLAAEGRTDADLAAYLARWSLYSDGEVALALGLLKPSPMTPYIFGYFHGWELLRPWASTRPDRVRRLLTEQLLPADIAL
ncbi:hypothetical protein EDD27_1605 [Nonomuraea polychroma]|uniref:DUF885 domain-containing protein n=1 Tax=Nonomuraea polychroma TaxID=46176 RepID=A0A438M0Y8_9ACTN|nr:hypothetical protein [Nonomuraea polychroma]RVX39257.1 hypothetical protein EDD27_1605 [Nonomuraea polychroma]